VSETVVTAPLGLALSERLGLLAEQMRAAGTNSRQCGHLKPR